MRTFLRNALAAAILCCAAPAFGQECSDLVIRSGSGLESFVGNLREAIKANDQARIFDLYKVISGRDVPDLQLATRQIVSDLLDNAVTALEQSPPDPAAFRTALTVLSNVETWRSCDTDADVVRIAEAAKTLRENENVDAAATTAIQRADGQLDTLLAREHPDAASMDATVARLEKLLGDPAFEDLSYVGLVDVALANKRQEAALWHVGFDTPFASVHAAIGDTADCQPENRACGYVRDANQQLDAIIADLEAAKDDPQDAGYFLYNDFVLLRAMNAVLANNVEYAKKLIRTSLVEAERNREIDWYNAERPLDHVYVYKFLRDPDEEGQCVEVQYFDRATNRCPVREFFNPVQLGEHILTALEALGQAGAAAATTPHALDQTLRQFRNHDYRVILDVLAGKAAPADAAYPDHLAQVLREQDTADWKCPADSRPLSQPGAPTLCLTMPFGGGMYEGYFFVGGDFDLSEAESVASRIAESVKLPIRPHPRRPLVKG
jgi:hypothetical protein